MTFVLPQWWLRPIGGYAVVYGHADGLARRGHEVHVLLGRPGQPELRAEAERRLAVGDPLVGWRPVDPRVRFALVDRIDDAGAPDADAVIATASQTAAPVAALAARKGRKLHLIQGLDTWMTDPNQFEAIWRAPTLKLPVSPWLYEVAQAHGAAPLHLVPNAVDHHRFTVTRDPQTRAPHLLTSYHHAPVKGWPDALAALQRLHARRPDVAVTVFGTPPPPEDLPPWARYLRDPADPAALYNAASVYMSASLSEGFGLTGAEALACGCALATTDSGGVRAYAEPGVTALMSPPGEPDALADNVLSLLADPALARRTREAGRARVAEFTWARATEALEAALALAGI